MNVYKISPDRWKHPIYVEADYYEGYEGNTDYYFYRRDPEGDKDFLVALAGTGSHIVCVEVTVQT